MKPTFGETQLMLTTSYKKLSQATAGIALGAAMLAAVNAPAQAATLTTYNFSGQFESLALPGSSGVSLGLQNGSFDGSYTVDVDQLPTATQVNLASWLVNVRDASNNILKTFSSAIVGNTGIAVNDGVRFTNFVAASTGAETASLGVVFNPGFTGSPGNGPTDGLFSSVIFSNSIVAGQIPIKSTPVPEPVSTAGIAVAGAMGLWMKRKQKSSIA
ncbi:PEP motif putative anchor domain protein [Nostoc sp. PCC 7107]|nr:PEP motif putative anchor domain protein [Nostoc sp. PCC 7107]